MRAFRSEFVLYVLLVLAGGPALAQAGNQNTPVTGPPQTLQQAAPAQPAPATQAGDQTSIVPAKPSVLGTGGEAAVQVGALGTIEGPLVGTLDDSNGGLGYAMWNGSDRATMETMLQDMPAASPSPVTRILLRRLLLTTAPPPVGPWHMPFTALRMEKLLEAGMLGDAADLAAKITGSTNEDIARAQANALLYAGRDADACGDETSYRLQSAEPFWIELRAYCYAVTNDAAALELTRAVIAAQEFQDSAFMALLGGMTGVKPKLPLTFASPTALHVRMLERLRLPLTVDLVNLGVPASLVALRSTATPLNVRLIAAAKALDAGALSGTQLAQALTMVPFKPKDLVGAAAMAPSEPVFQGLARICRALRTETNPAKRSELIYTALKIGAHAGLFAEAAQLFDDEAAALPASLNSSDWAPLLTRALLLTGKVDAAGEWQNIMNQAPSKNQEAIAELQLAFTLAVPNDARNAEAQASLSWLADQVSGPNATDDSRAKAALYVGLFDALGRPIGPQLQSRLAGLINPNLPGRRPAPALMMRVEASALAGRRGEGVLVMINAMGRQGPAGLAPDVTVRFVRALQTLGLHDAAHILAIEAVLVAQE